MSLSGVSPNAQLVSCHPRPNTNTGDPFSFYSFTQPQRSVATLNGVASMSCISSGT